MDAVDGCGCCTAADIGGTVMGVVQHLQPIVLRAVSNEREPLTRAERPECDRVIKARRAHLLPSRVNRPRRPSIATGGPTRISPSTVGHSQSRRVELTRIASDLFNDRAPPYQPQLEQDRHEN